MTNHPDIGFGDAEKAGDIGPAFFVIETHNDNGPLAFPQTLHAMCKPVMVQARLERLRRSDQVWPELFEEAFLSLSASTLIEHRHPTRSEHEGCEFFRFAQ